MTSLNAQVVWHVWRRVLREPALQQALFCADPDTALDESFGLSGEARTAALAYAAQADRARWFVTNYRFRLTNSFLNALETGAPLTLRALLALGHDVHASAHAYLERCGWQDHGPYVHAYCKEALAFLRDTLGSEQLNRLNALIAFEERSVDWLIDLGRLQSPHTPDADVVPRSGLMERTAWACHYRSDMRLSAWLRDKSLLGKAPLEAGVEHYFIYLRDAQSAVRFARVPARAVLLYDALDRPRTREELSDALVQRGAGPLTDADRECLAMLESCRAIRGSGAVPS